MKKFGYIRGGDIVEKRKMLVKWGIPDRQDTIVIEEPARRKKSNDWKDEYPLWAHLLIEALREGGSVHVCGLEDIGKNGIDVMEMIGLISKKGATLFVGETAEAYKLPKTSAPITTDYAAKLRLYFNTLRTAPARAKRREQAGKSGPTPFYRLLERASKEAYDKVREIWSTKGTTQDAALSEINAYLEKEKPMGPKGKNKTSLSALRNEFGFKLAAEEAAHN